MKIIQDGSGRQSPNMMKYWVDDIARACLMDKAGNPTNVPYGYTMSLRANSLSWQEQINLLAKAGHLAQFSVGEVQTAKEGGGRTAPHAHLIMTAFKEWSRKETTRRIYSSLRRELSATEYALIEITYGKEADTLPGMIMYYTESYFRGDIAAKLVVGNRIAKLITAVAPAPATPQTEKSLKPPPPNKNKEDRGRRPSKRQIALDRSIEVFTSGLIDKDIAATLELAIAAERSTGRKSGGIRSTLAGIHREVKSYLQARTLAGNGFINKYSDVSAAEDKVVADLHARVADLLKIANWLLDHPTPGFVSPDADILRWEAGCTAMTDKGDIPHTPLIGLSKSSIRKFIRLLKIGGVDISSLPAVRRRARAKKNAKSSGISEQDLPSQTTLRAT